MQREATCAVLFPYFFTFGVISLRELYFEERKAKKDERINNQLCTIIRKFREENQNQIQIKGHKNSVLSNLHDQDHLLPPKAQQVSIYSYIHWKDLKIGDIVLLKKDEVCPADILIMDMFDQQCTVNTQNIDDKSDGKIKTASDLMFQPKNSQMKGNHVQYRKLLTGKFSFKGVQDSFKGLVKLKKDPVAQELSEEQFIMRGSQIQFTEWILGLVIEVGMQTYIYRKFKKPKILFYNSNFMKKQFMYSAISVIFLAIIIIINLALMQVNTCLKGGLNSLDWKFILSSLLFFPLYYHAFTEVILLLYSIYINKANDAHEQHQPLKQTVSSPLSSLSNIKNGQVGQQNSLTLADLKQKMEDKNSSSVNLKDCLSSLNDTRSLVDLCLTTHLVFNTANTLTTGQSHITGILISSVVYQIDVTQLKQLNNRVKSKIGTLCAISPTASLKKELKRKRPNESSPIKNEIPKILNLNNPEYFLDNSPPDKAGCFPSQNSKRKGEVDDQKIFNFEDKIVEEDSKKLDKEKLTSQFQLMDSGCSFETPNQKYPSNNALSRDYLLRKDMSLMIDYEENTNNNTQNNKESEPLIGMISISMIKHQRTLSNLQLTKDFANNSENPLATLPQIQIENLKTPDDQITGGPSSIMNGEKEGRQEQEYDTDHNHSTISDTNSQNRQRKKEDPSIFENSNNIQFEMNSFQSDTRVTRQDLINNHRLQKFFNSLDLHKKNDHQAYQVQPKIIPLSDQPIPEEEEIKERDATRKRTRESSRRQKSGPFNYNSREEYQFSGGSESNHRSQLSQHLKNSVAKGIHKTFIKAEEDSSLYNGSSKGKFRNSMVKSMVNQLNYGYENNEVLGVADFVNQHLNQDSLTYCESQEIIEAMLLCHYTRSFYNSDEQKIINRSFSSTEELQLQLGAALEYTFEFSCYIEGDQYYVLKRDSQYQKYQVLTYFYFPQKDRFCILINYEGIYTIFVKEEIVNISDITYLNESLLTELSGVCNYYRTQGNRIILYCKKEISESEISCFVEKMDQKENLAALFDIELSLGAQFLTVVAIKEKTLPGLEVLFQQLKDSKMKSWIATGEKLSKVIPICFSTGILDKNHKIISYESEEYDKLAFQIRNMLQQLKDGFQRAYNSQKTSEEGNGLGNILNRQSNRNRSHTQNITDNNDNSNNQLKRVNVRQLSIPGVRKIKRLNTSQSQVRQSRKSIVSGMELENQFKFSILVSGAAFKEISNNTYLNNHFIFICYFAQSVVGFDMTPEQKGQLVRVINTKMNQNYKTLFIGDTLADFSAFTDSNISAYKKSQISQSQNFPGIQYEGIENMLSLLLFHSRMVTEICEDVMTFSLYRGMLFIFLLFLQYQFCEIDYQVYNLASLLIISFLNMSIESSVLVLKKYRKYKSVYLTSNTLTSQFSTLQEFSNHQIPRRLIKIVIHSLFDFILFYFLTHYLLINISTAEGYTLSSQFVNYIEQYFTLSLLPTVRLFSEYTFKIKEIVILSFILQILPLVGFAIDPILRQAIKESFEMIKEAQFFLFLIFLPLFLCSSNKLVLFCFRLKVFPLIKSYDKLSKLMLDSVKESYFVKPKEFNIAKLIRQIFLSNEPDIILSSYILSEQVNVRETSMNKWTLQFKDNNIEMRFQSLYKKKTHQYSKFVSSISLIFIEFFIFYRTVLYNIGNFNEFPSSFYTVFFIGAFFLMSIQVYLCFMKKNQENLKEIGTFILFIRLLYFLIIINVAELYDSVPGILICIFLSITSLPLLRLDRLVFTGLIVMIIIVLSQFNVISKQQLINNYADMKSLSKIHIILGRIEISFFSFLVFLLQKRNFEETERKNFLVNQTLSQATQKMKDTLSILLPRFIREKLYSGQNYDKISTNQGNVAILFCDVTNFDEIMMQEGEKIVRVLDALFRQFDKSCSANQVLKIETVGKTYMAAAGLRDVDDYQQQDQVTVKTIIDPVKRCIQVALEMQEIAKSITWGDSAEGGKFGKVEIKIGINYGTVISGVIGFHKPQFSLIGDTVNTASRVCSTGSPQEINISASSYQRVALLRQFKFTHRVVEAKGKGQMTTYVVKLKKSNSTFYKSTLKKENDKPRERLKPQPLVSELKIPISQTPQARDNTNGKQSTFGIAIQRLNSQQQLPKDPQNGSNDGQPQQNGISRLRSTSSFGVKIFKPSAQIQSSNNLQAFEKRKMVSQLDINSVQNLIAHAEEVIEPIKNAEKGLNCEHKIDMQKLTHHGLNQEYYDFKNLKSQYQEEKDEIIHKSGVDSQANDKLQLNYWTGDINYNSISIEDGEEQDELIGQFWSTQIDETQAQIGHLIAMIILQLFLYTFCFFFKVGMSQTINLLLVIRCTLIFILFIFYALRSKLLKIVAKSLKRLRIVLISLYIFLFGILNIELWFASSTSSVSQQNLFSDKEMKEVVTILIYEIYLVYFIFFRQRIFTFIHQGSLFLLTFGVIIAHNIVVEISYEGIFVKIIFLQILLFFNSHQLFMKDLQNFNTLKSQNDKNKQADKLVQYLLPTHILQHLLMNPTSHDIISEQFDKQTILFADIAGFTHYSDQKQPETVVKMLRTLFTEFDQKCQYHKVFKVYTIGDCYVIIGNTNHEARDPSEEAYNVLNMAFQMIEILQNEQELVQNEIDMRIGIHTGKIVGGLIGTQIVRYDIYGLDVMIANKMESNGTKGCIVVSEVTKEILEEKHEGKFIFSEKGDVYIKQIDAHIRTYYCDKNPI